ncbi:hypothetical protein [Acaryochloris marina]|uniref:Uncharacterized protein n=1 Tax=Acaryochloris marina (strain MBIC 11017) TaxID=329726 RepID=A8ZNA7_ACAM1|nr:hypothetical protein [Acaryochloris marina]ABW32305.1 hypothetical protein AM1_C0378 [Acaryochloris marina MBIC11017]
MSEIYSDDIQSRVFPENRKPQERSLIEIEDRSGWRRTEIVPGPPPMPGSDWISPYGGTVINSRRVD